MSEQFFSDEEITSDLEDSVLKEVTVTEEDIETLKTRNHFDDDIIKMFYDKIGDNNFYANIISQCKVVITKSLDTLGVSFRQGTYYLAINPDFYNKMNREERIDVLKHEMLHIMYKHLTIRGDYEKHEQANIAMDMAINQVLKNLPDNCIDYRDYKGFPAGLNAEQYYELLEKDEKFQEYLKRKAALQAAFANAIANGQLDGNGNPVDGDGNPIDIPNQMHAEHNWQMSDEEKEMLDEATKDMLNKAIDKSIGNTPHNISDILDLFTNAPQVNWKKELKNMVGNKKANHRPTIKRRNRRQQHRMDLNGRTKDTTFELICLLDVSGSMSDPEILVPLNEVREICKMTNTGMTVIQIDTEVKCLTEFDKNTTHFTRSGCGGTYMYDGIRYLMENNIKYDGIVFISDLHIEEVADWEKKPRVPIFWLTETPHDQGTQVQDEPRHKRFHIDCKTGESIND